MQQSTTRGSDASDALLKIAARQLLSESTPGSLRSEASRAHRVQQSGGRWGARGRLLVLKPMCREADVYLRISFLPKRPESSFEMDMPMLRRKFLYAEKGDYCRTKSRGGLNRSRWVGKVSKRVGLDDRGRRVQSRWVDACASGPRGGTRGGTRGDDTHEERG